jgi:hypothetical protein
VDGLEAAGLAAEHAVRGDGDGLAAFQRSIAQGVSANLCEALSNLIEWGCGLGISVTWAKTRPTPEPRRKIEFSRAEGEVFREAARLLRYAEPRPDEQLHAYVIAADRKMEKDEGVVTLKSFVDGQPVSIRTILPRPIYSTALTAHDSKQPISITGDLVRKGQRWWLEHPRNLMISSDDLSDE